MTTALWQLTDVTLHGRTRPRLDRVTVAVPSGICAVMGQSGAGKTSLLNLLVGYERPDAGRIEVPPSSILNPQSSANRLPVYWAPPDDGLWAHLTVREHLTIVAPRGAAPPDTDMERAPEEDLRTQARTGRLKPELERAQPAGRRVPVTEAMSLVDRLLAEFDLRPLAEQKPSTLSEGERSRLCVARALAGRAQVLVMDEPLVHVDPLRLPDYWDAVREHCRESGATLLFASHDAETVLREAEQVICLDRGRVVYCGPVSELYDSPPSPELARFLGPINWLTGDEAAEWLHVRSEKPLSLRAEKLQLREAADSPVVIEAARFAGLYGEADLHDERTGHRRRVYHRPAERLRRGMRVALSATLALCVALLCAGCEENEPQSSLRLTQKWVQSLPVEAGFLPAPRAMDISPDGELFVLDDVGRVIVYGPDGALRRKWWMPDYTVGRPEGIEVLRDGRMAIADTHYHRVIICDQQGVVLHKFGEEGEAPGQFIFPCDVTQDDAGNLYVSEYGGNDRIQKFSEQGEFLAEWGEPGTGPGQFQRAGGLDWHQGAIYIADAINNRIQAFSDAGRLLGTLADSSAAGLDYPYDLRVLANETMLVAEYKSGRVTLLSLTGEVLGQYGTTGRGAAQFWTPWGLAATDDGRLVVADTGNRRIVELAL